MCDQDLEFPPLPSFRNPCQSLGGVGGMCVALCDQSETQEEEHVRNLCKSALQSTEKLPFKEAGSSFKGLIKNNSV